MEKSRGDVKPFLEHLEDFRWTILRMLIALAAATVVCYIFHPQLLKIIVRPLRAATADPEALMERGMLLQALSPTDSFVVSLRISLLAGLVAAMPVLLAYAGGFILPALTRTEKKYIWPATASGFALFVVGVLFSYFIVLPIALRYLWNYSLRMGIVNMWTVERYCAFFVRFVLAFGLAFEMPVVILVLVKLGIVDHSFLKSNRSYVVVGILILAAVLTPPDVFTMLILAGPMILLYEACVWLAKAMEKKERLAG